MASQQAGSDVPDRLLSEQEKYRLERHRRERLNPLTLILMGAVLLLIMAGLFFLGGENQEDNDAVLEQAKQPIRQVSGAIQKFRRDCGC